MKLGQDIVKYRYIIMGVFVGLVVLACCLFPSMMEKVNYDFTSYLPRVSAVISAAALPERKHPAGLKDCGEEEKPDAEASGFY